MKKNLVITQPTMANKDPNASNNKPLHWTRQTQRRFVNVKTEESSDLDDDPTNNNIISTKRKRTPSLIIKGSLSPSGADESESIGVWRENAVGPEAKKLLEAVEQKYPTTFQSLQICGKSIWLNMLKELHVVIKKFVETSVDTMVVEDIISLREDLSIFQGFGFDLSWAIERLEMVNRLKFGNEPLVKELVELEDELEKLNLRVDKAHDFWRKEVLERDAVANARVKKVEKMVEEFGAEHDQVLKGQLALGMLPGELESGTGLNQEVGIKRPSDTRWGSHFASLLNIKNIYSSICEVLVELGKHGSDRDHKAEALRTLKLVKSFDFVFCLHLMVDILGVTNHLNTSLQRKDQDIVNAMNQVSCSKKAIQEIRDVGWETLLGNVTLFCDKYEVRIIDMEDEYYDGFSRRKASQVNNLHHYHIDVFKEVVDMQLQELNHRFNEANTKLLLCIACLCPRESFKAFDLDKLKEMATLYKEEFPTEYDLQVLEVELKNYIRDVREDERFNHLDSQEDGRKTEAYNLS